MKNLGGHFAPKLGGHFELESGGHFKLELGGQYHWNLQSSVPTLPFLVNFLKISSLYSDSNPIPKSVTLICNLFSTLFISNIILLSLFENLIEFSIKLIIT